VADHEAYATDPYRVMTECFELIDQQYIALANQLELDDGSTATLLLLELDAKTKQLKYFLACAGDSRAIIIKNNGDAKVLVEDHNPTREDERERIKAEGGRVLFDVLATRVAAWR